MSLHNKRVVLLGGTSGIGIILQPEMMLHEDIASGRLVRLLPDYPMPNFPVHLVYLPDRRMTPKLSSFVEFMLERFGLEPGKGKT